MGKLLRVAFATLGTAPEKAGLDLLPLLRGPRRALQQSRSLGGIGRNLFWRLATLGLQKTPTDARCRLKGRLSVKFIWKIAKYHSLETATYNTTLLGSPV
jgi:hypothetical protein